MQLSSIKVVMLAYVAGALALEGAGCHKGSTNDVPSTSRTTTMPHDNPPLALRYSALKVEGIDANGHLTFAKYDGKTVVIDATVTDVRLTKKSASIAIENDIAYFALDSAQSIPGHSEFSSIELKFDQYSTDFVKGEKWRFTFAEDGTLVSLEPILRK
jgi:hypothetical protein